MDDFYKPNQAARMFLNTMTSHLLSVTMQKNANEWAGENKKCYYIDCDCGAF